MVRKLKWAALGLVGLIGLILAILLGAKLLWSVTDAPPELATGLRAVPETRAQKMMVAAANPLAAEAGLEILRSGGSAIDAAIAVQMALTVVEPQSSGIGGGAFLVYWDAKARKLRAWDGRETAPAAATPQLFMHEDGSPMDFVESVVGGRSVGVPGVVRMLDTAHREHGSLAWEKLFTPAIGLATSFDVSPRLNQLARWDPLLRAQPFARRHFYDEDGRAKEPGTALKNAELAEVFETLARDGADAFYAGPIAQDIVAAVRNAKRPGTVSSAISFAMTRFLGSPTGLDTTADIPNPGTLTLDDLRDYRAKERDPICIPYRKFRVCGMPPPTSGGITTLQILGILSHFDLSRLKPRSAEAMHLIAEAARLAFADRDKYIADPDFVRVPTEQLLSPEYLASRAALVKLDAAASKAQPGTPAGVELGWAMDESPELPSTSHFCVVDGAGNVATMTTSIENVFGSRVFVRGFLLNNQLTDFSFVPERDGTPIANAVAPGKRPRSSMSPIMVLDPETDRPFLAIGSPGGSRIINYVAQATVGVLDWGLGPQQAISLPHVVNRNGATELESMGWPEGELDDVKARLEALGHEVSVGEQNSGLHAILSLPDGLLGGADPRREGVAVGE